jgi:anthranilate/para-aminobenzoate synthase component I
VADSNPEAEYEETLAKARGFFAALNLSGMETDHRGAPAIRSSD